MKLIRCRKCGTVITTQETMIDNMMDELNRLNRLAEKAAKHNRSMMQVYQQEAIQVRKLIGQIIHLTSQMDEHARRVLQEKSVIIHYALENNLLTMDKIHELELIARERAAKADERDQREIKKIYGDFESMLTNRTKKDPTAKEAIKGE